MTFKEKLVLKTANKLLKANNTVTTLEIKLQLRKDCPLDRWNQKLISSIMDGFQLQGIFTYKDNGTYRVYSDPKAPIRLPLKKKAMKKSATPVLVKKATVPSVKTVVSGTKKTLSRTKAHDLMVNNKGRFFTATFIDKKGQVRVMNCQYLKDQGASTLGYIKVKEAGKCKKGTGDCIRNVNLQTLTNLSIGGTIYKIK